MLKKATTAAMTMLLLSAVACKGSSDSTPVASGAPSKAPIGALTVTVEFRLDSSMTTQSAQLQSGDTLEVRLESNSSTGYTWSVSKAPDKKVLKQQGSPDQVPAVSPVPGAPGVQVFTFTPVGPGNTDISFEYARPFGNGKPANIARVDVGVM